MSASVPHTVDDALLRAWPLPEAEEDGDKERRGSVLVVAGSREMPGAAVLAGTAALRAGAGKLVIATPQSAAPTVAGAVPEARVVALPEAAAPTFYSKIGEWIFPIMLLLGLGPIWLAPAAARRGQ